MLWDVLRESRQVSEADLCKDLVCFIKKMHQVDCKRQSISQNCMPVQFQMKSSLRGERNEGEKGEMNI